MFFFMYLKIKKISKVKVYLIKYFEVKFFEIKCFSNLFILLLSRKKIIKDIKLKKTQKYGFYKNDYGLKQKF